MAKNKTPFTAKEKANVRLDLRQEIVELETLISELKKQYEQYFSGLLSLAPEKLHANVKRKIRELLNAPFKNQTFSFKLKTLEGRYNTFNTYWQRTLKEREAGTYSKDVFKANLREKIAEQESREQTTAGKAEKSMQVLFNSYKEALEKTTGRKQELDFPAFQKSLVERAKELKNKYQDKKVSFKVEVKDGKVSVKARLKDKTKENA